jgi:hypothetical protein
MARTSGSKVVFGESAIDARHASSILAPGLYRHMSRQVTSVLHSRLSVPGALLRWLGASLILPSPHEPRHDGRCRYGQRRAADRRFVSTRRRARRSQLSHQCGYHQLDGECLIEIRIQVHPRLIPTRIAPRLSAGFRSAIGQGQGGGVFVFRRGSRFETRA